MSLASTSPPRPYCTSVPVAGRAAAVRADMVASVGDRFGNADWTARRRQAVPMALRTTTTWWGARPRRSRRTRAGPLLRSASGWKVFNEDADGGAVAPSEAASSTSHARPRSTTCGRCGLRCRAHRRCHAPRHRGRRSRRGSRARGRGRRGTGDAPAAGHCARHARSGRSPVLPVPRRTRLAPFATRQSPLCWPPWRRVLPNTDDRATGDVGGAGGEAVSEVAPVSLRARQERHALVEGVCLATFAV